MERCMEELLFCDACPSPLLMMLLLLLLLLLLELSLLPELLVGVFGCLAFVRDETDMLPRRGGWSLGAGLCFKLQNKQVELEK